MTRKIFLLAFAIMNLVACGPKTKTTPDHVIDTDTSKTIQTPENTAPVIINKAIKKEEYDAGLALVYSSDCKGCHKPQEKVIGPAYQDIANKYPINKITIDTLTEKVIKGGAGNWGQIPMQAHANISKEDARQMVKYILAFKNN